jgi:hypothetical protein
MPSAVDGFRAQDVVRLDGWRFRLWFGRNRRLVCPPEFLSYALPN